MSIMSNLHSWILHFDFFFNNEVVNGVKQLGYSQQIWHKEGEDNGLNWENE